jgi:hypothetical protein
MAIKPNRATASTATKSVRGIRELKSKITALIESFPAANQAELAKQGGRWMASEFAKKIKASAPPAKKATRATTKRAAPKSSAKTLTRGQKAAATRKANAAAKAAGSTMRETTAQLD